MMGFNFAITADCGAALCVLITLCIFSLCSLILFDLGLIRVLKPRLFVVVGYWRMLKPSSLSENTAKLLFLTIALTNNQ